MSPGCPWSSFYFLGDSSLTLFLLLDFVIFLPYDTSIVIYSLLLSALGLILALLTLSSLIGSCFGHVAFRYAHFCYIVLFSIIILFLFIMRNWSSGSACMSMKIVISFNGNWKIVWFVWQSNSICTNISSKITRKLDLEGEKRVNQIGTLTISSVLLLIFTFILLHFPSTFFISIGTLWL